MSHFFSYRGLLKLVACTPYENQEPWKIAAILYKGKIYLCARMTEHKLRDIQNMTPQRKKFTSWGHKFEQYVLSDSPNTSPKPEHPNDETKEFSLVLKTKLNNHRLYYAAETDGLIVTGDTPPPPDKNAGQQAIVDYLASKNFVELKTCRIIDGPRMMKNFRLYKTKQWWCQSFLAGVDTIACGFRDDRGVVSELKVYKVKELPKMGICWSANVCINFLDKFLDYVKSCLKRQIINKHGEKSLGDIKAVPLTAILLEWDTDTRAVRVSQDYDYCDDPILPGWFLDEYQKE